MPEWHKAYDDDEERVTGGPDRRYKLCDRATARANDEHLDVAPLGPDYLSRRDYLHASVSWFEGTVKRGWAHELRGPGALVWDTPPPDPVLEGLGPRDHTGQWASVLVTVERRVRETWSADHAKARANAERAQAAHDDQIARVEQGRDDAQAAVGRLRAGLAGEQRVADAVADLDDVWFATAEVQFKGNADADLVVVGPCLAAVEVKGSKGHVELARRGTTLTLACDGQEVKGAAGKGPLEQVRMAAEDLAEVVVPWTDRPASRVVCVTGMTNEPFAVGGDTWVCSADDLPDVLRGLPAVLDDRGTARTIAKLLEARLD